MTKIVDVIVEQSKETELHEESDEAGITIRYSYYRAAETREKNKNGQDYIAFHLEPGKAIFALCDGVSQSFSGDIGARLLGNCLIKWLNNAIRADEHIVSPNEPEKNKLMVNSLIAKLTKELVDLKQEASKEIYKRDISTIDDEWLREELEDRRELHGTQSNFTCGIIEAPRKGLPYGRVIIFWLGDAKLRWYVGMQDRTDQLGAKWITDERWSSKSGIVGETIHGFMDITYKISTLVAHSDGMDPFPVQWYQPFIQRKILDSHFMGLWERPSNDDVSFIEINIQNNDYPPLSSLTPTPKTKETSIPQSMTIVTETPITPSENKPKPDISPRVTNIPELRNESQINTEKVETKGPQIAQPSTTIRENDRHFKDLYETPRSLQSQTSYRSPSSYSSSSRDLNKPNLDNNFDDEEEQHGVRGWLKNHNIELRAIITIALIIGAVILLWFLLPSMCKLLTLWPMR